MMRGTVFPAHDVFVKSQESRPILPIISISNLNKTYASGLRALENVDLEIRKGEIFALLGPNGAGKTTLISIVCGIVTPSSGTVRVDGRDILRDYRETRSKIGGQAFQQFSPMPEASPHGTMGAERRGE